MASHELSMEFNWWIWCFGVFTLQWETVRPLLFVSLTNELVVIYAAVSRLPSYPSLSHIHRTMYACMYAFIAWAWITYITTYNIIWKREYRTRLHKHIDVGNVRVWHSTNMAQWFWWPTLKFICTKQSVAFAYVYSTYMQFNQMLR